MKQEIIEFILSITQRMGVSAVVEVTVPENPSHGDYSTNVAMRLAKELKKSPMVIAAELKDAIIQGQKASKAPWLDRVEVVPPGFINLFVSEASLVTELNRVLAEGKTYGNAHSQASSLNTQYSIHNTEASKKEGVSSVKKPVKKDILSGGKKSGKNVDKSRKNAAKEGLDRTGKTIMIEFAQPNTHKAFHIGHLRNIVTGESLVRLYEAIGWKVIRGNYQGDVGMHIAKALYGLMEVPEYKEQFGEIQTEEIHQKVAFLGKAYAAGSKAFEDDEAAKSEIKDLNALIYAAAQRFAQERGINPGTTDYLTLVKPENRHRVDEVYALWKETRQWSLDYFDSIYKRVYTHFDRLYFESESLAGVDMSRDAVKKGILKESDGAIIFDGKPYGLDTRVFVNSLGLPTYEGKELALVDIKFHEYVPIDRHIHVLGPEQKSFTSVTYKVEELLNPALYGGKMMHLAYGWLKLKKGKMSSRLGNVILGEDILDATKDAIYTILDKSESKYSKEDHEAIAETIAIAAIKYSFLKVSIASEISFDIEESINTHGDSGPYLQYTYARARSVLRKAQGEGQGTSNKGQGKQNTLSLISGHLSLNNDERLLSRLLAQFPDIVKDAAENYAPSTLCTYLFALAQQFNAFYANNPILDPSAISHQPSAGQKTESRKLTAESSLRLALTHATAQVLKNGLYLLGIATLEQM